MISWQLKQTFLQWNIDFNINEMIYSETYLALYIHWLGKSVGNKTFLQPHTHTIRSHISTMEKRKSKIKVCFVNCQWTVGLYVSGKRVYSITWHNFRMPTSEQKRGMWIFLRFFSTSYFIETKNLKSRSRNAFCWAGQKWWQFIQQCYWMSTQRKCQCQYITHIHNK